MHILTDRRERGGEGGREGGKERGMEDGGERKRWREEGGSREVITCLTVQFNYLIHFTQYTTN